MSLSCWRELLAAAMERHGDRLENAEALRVRECDSYDKGFDQIQDKSGFLRLDYPEADVFLDREFYDGYGANEGIPFFLWTKTRVYFPVCYDGMEWVASVPRNPTEENPKHFGGG